MTPVGTRDILEFGVAGQTLGFEAPQGRPSADGTVAVYDSRYPQAQAPQNPIVAASVAARIAVDTTLSAIAGPSAADPRAMTLVSGANVAVGDPLFVVTAAGQVERIEVASVNGTAVYAVHPLAFDYAVGAKVQSARMTSPAIPTAWVSDANNLGADYYALWTYTVGSITYRARTGFDLARAGVQDADLLIILGHVYERYPGLRAFTYADHPEGHVDLVRAGVRDVEQHMRLRGIEPARLKGGYDLQAWLRELRVAQLIARNGNIPNIRDKEKFVEEVTADWDQAFLQFTEHTVPVPYDDDDDDVIQPGERRAMTISLRK